MRSRTFLAAFFLSAVCILYVPPVSTAGVASRQAEIAALGNLSQSIQSISSTVSPAVVQIIDYGYGPGPGGRASDLLSAEVRTGSGVIVDSAGYIVTNAHVVEGARRIQVILAAPASADSDWQSVLKPAGAPIPAHVVGIDHATDLAVLHIDRSGLPHLKLADSDHLQQGELVLAFGSPLGLENTMTMGVVSAIARQLKVDDPMIYIQTDAAINPGNSGGALVNVAGEVVGLNTMIFSQSGGNEGIGFAIPSNIVKSVYQQIRQKGRVERGIIGVYAQTITPELAQAVNLPRNWGVIIGDVDPGSPAEAAGMAIGDIVISLDGRLIENGRQFDIEMYRKKIGETATIKLLRDTDTVVVKPTVVERPGDPSRFIDMVDPDKNLVDKLGIVGINVDKKVAELVPDIRVPSGVLVAALAADRTSWAGGLAQGDIIHFFDRTPVVDLKTLRAAVANIREGDTVAALVERNGRMRFVAFQIE